MHIGFSHSLMVIDYAVKCIVLLPVPTCHCVTENSLRCSWGPSHLWYSDHMVINISNNQKWYYSIVEYILVGPIVQVFTTQEFIIMISNHSSTFIIDGMYVTKENKFMNCLHVFWKKRFNNNKSVKGFKHLYCTCACFVYLQH